MKCFAPVPACSKPVITLALNTPYSLDSSVPSHEFWVAGREGVSEGGGKERKIMIPFTFCPCLLFPLSPWSSHIPRCKSLVSSEPKSPWSEQPGGLSRWPVGWHRTLQVLFLACLHLWIAKHILAQPTDHLRQSHTRCTKVPFAKYCDSPFQVTAVEFDPGARLPPFQSQTITRVIHPLWAAQPLLYSEECSYGCSQVSVFLLY